MSDKHSNNNPNKKISTHKNTPPPKNTRPADKRPINKPTKSKSNKPRRPLPKETKNFERVRNIQTAKTKNKPTKSSEEKFRFQTVEEQEKISKVDADAQAADFFNRPLPSKDKAYSKPLTPAKAPISDYRRKVKRIFFYIVTLVVLISICSVLSLTVFFKIDNIVVANNDTTYKDDDIVAASLINKGDNLILCTTAEGERNIEKKFPYIEDASISKQLFNQVTITIKKAVPTYIIESAGKYVVLSKSGKAIEINDERKYNDVPMINGAKLKDIKMSSTIQYENDNIRKYVDELISNIKKYKIKNIKTIDIASLTKIKLVRDNGFTIIVGNPENIEYKIKTAATIMAQGVKDDMKGTLDVSLASADGGKSYLSSNVDSSEPSKDTGSSSSGESSTEENSDEESSEEVSESTEEPVEPTGEGSDTYTESGEDPYTEGGDTYTEGGEDTYTEGGDIYTEGGDDEYTE